jgi:CDP-diacylglycerol--glycerol-3-phosphate 3-phosphatidyltransferase
MLRHVMPVALREQAANLVTAVRVVLVLPFWLAFERTGVPFAAIAIGCAFFMELSDLLDGTVARRLGVVTDLGKLLDPAADSFSRLAVFLALATHPSPGGNAPWFPAWALLVLIFRDVSVSFLRQVSASRGVVIAARTSGKIKALAQGGGIWVILALHLRATVAGAPDEVARTIATGASLALVAVTLVSLVDYVWGARDAFKTT